jgi:hypothetical protein
MCADYTLLVDQGYNKSVYLYQTMDLYPPHPHTTANNVVETLIL